MKGKLQSLRGRALLKYQGLRLKDFWYQRKIEQVKNLGQSDRHRRGIRRTVRLLSNFPGLWQRTLEQTPGASCQWGSTLFLADGEADHYVILNSMFSADGSNSCPGVRLPDPSRVWGLHMEPEEYVRVLGYDQPQEHSLVSRFYSNCETLIKKAGIYRPSPPYVHFHTGRSWDYLRSADVPRKSRNLGLITSDLTTLAGHVSRMQFLTKLDKASFDCAIWGRGKKLQALSKYRGFVLDKWNVHAACRYSVVIENSVAPWYWSEKFADAILGYSLPLYHGCPSIGRFFPEESFIRIDIDDADCVQRIADIVDSGEYERRLPAIREARRLILERENLYAFLDREFESDQA